MYNERALKEARKFWKEHERKTDAWLKGKRYYNPKQRLKIKILIGLTMLVLFIGAMI